MSKLAIIDNVAMVRQRIAAAARRAGRRESDVRLIAVSKGVEPERIAAAVAAGVTDLGENRVQEATRKAPSVPAGAVWHLIGSLQTNKVKAAVQLFDWIHSVDRYPLALELSRRAGEMGRTVTALVQVNVSGEASKSGIAPVELADFLDAVSRLPHLQTVGLMTIAPLAADPEEARPHFRQLRRLLVAQQAVQRPQVHLHHLSMGMSGDLEVAIEEGATFVRVGTALFGPRA